MNNQEQNRNGRIQMHRLVRSLVAVSFVFASCVVILMMIVLWQSHYLKQLEAQIEELSVKLERKRLLALLRTRTDNAEDAESETERLLAVLRTRTGNAGDASIVSSRGIRVRRSSPDKRDKRGRRRKGHRRKAKKNKNRKNRKKPRRKCKVVPTKPKKEPKKEQKKEPKKNATTLQIAKRLLDQREEQKKSGINKFVNSQCGGGLLWDQDLDKLSLPMHHSKDWTGFCMWEPHEMDDKLYGFEPDYDRILVKHAGTYSVAIKAKMLNTGHAVGINILQEHGSTTSQIAMRCSKSTSGGDVTSGLQQEFLEWDVTSVLHLAANTKLRFEVQSNESNVRLVVNEEGPYFSITKQLP